METDRSTTAFFNPLFAWTDLGLRAAEMTVASTQSMSEAFDRMTRAGAGLEPSALALAAPARAAPPMAIGQDGDPQRTLFDLMTQGWLRWMSALGTLASLPAGIGLARTVAKRDNPLEAVRASLRLGAWAEKPATAARNGRVAAASQRQQRDAGDMQHALASGEAKARRKPAAKRKGARRPAHKAA